MNKQINTCDLQIRSVPVGLHEELTELANAAGLDLSAFLRRELHELARRRSMKELFERLKTRDPVRPGLSAEEIIRQDRDSR